MTSLAKPTLIYFPVPARGEITRLMFMLGKVDFEDKRIAPAAWPAMKPTTPFGQLPLLVVGSAIIAQSAAIDHYAASLSGMIPEDPLAALASDQAYFFVAQDIHAALMSPTMRIADPQEQVKARQELASRPLKDKLVQLDKLVESKPGAYLAGDKLSLGDLAVFNFLCMLRSGFWKGIPSDIVSSFPALKSFRHHIASLPEVAAHYATATDELRKNGYTPDEDAE